MGARRYNIWVVTQPVKEAAQGIRYIRYQCLVNFLSNRSTVTSCSTCMNECWHRENARGLVSHGKHLKT